MDQSMSELMPPFGKMVNSNAMKMASINRSYNRLWYESYHSVFLDTVYAVYAACTCTCNPTHSV